MLEASFFLSRESIHFMSPAETNHVKAYRQHLYEGEKHPSPHPQEFSHDYSIWRRHIITFWWSNREKRIVSIPIRRQINNYKTVPFPALVFVLYCASLTKLSFKNCMLGFAVGGKLSSLQWNTLAVVYLTSGTRWKRIYSWTVKVKIRYLRTLAFRWVFYLSECNRVFEMAYKPSFVKVLL